jgi:hypothetical protein
MCAMCALCAINGIIPIKIKVEETWKFYGITKGIGTHYEREMEMENWNHLVTHVKIIQGYEDSSHPVQAYTDGSKGDLCVGAVIAIFLDSNLTATLKYRLNGRCTNNRAEQMAIPKALEYTGCNRRNVRDFGRVFLMLNYTDITQNTYIQS